MAIVNGKSQQVSVRSIFAVRIQGVDNLLHPNPLAVFKRSHLLELPIGEGAPSKSEGDGEIFKRGVKGKLSPLWVWARPMNLIFSVR